jgi:predicted phage-related endonuclease
MAVNARAVRNDVDRRHFIGGSDARIIMGQDEKALIRLWQEKRGEVGWRTSRQTSSSNSV